MGELSRQLQELLESMELSKRATAPAQAGIFSHQNPSAYNAADPIRLWVIQIIIIIGFTQLLSLILGRIRQPRVISEVIGGIILGPSIMGRIPNFTNTVFPQLGMPLLNLTANIGLVLFLFIVGLEIDVRVVKRNVRASLAISIAGLIIPLGLGAALGVPIYHQFGDSSINFGLFLLFTAVAVGITAFPVLCRILTELKLLDTTVGVVTLSAGVGNDVVGWILLALTVALVNAGSGITALWVLLTGIGFVLFMLLPVKWGYKWLCRRTGSLEAGHPTALVMTVTLILVFTSAFFTDVIGIHAIFGGFLAGLVIPHENGFAISLLEKLEDLVCLLFLPLYFAYSGLNTNLGLLNTGKTWGYTILICVVSFFAKFTGCFTTAKLTGFNLRESGAIGSLMACKGLVELIVLNVGLSAGILNVRTFSMFVLHAVVLTFITTPLTLLFYPEKYRTRYTAPAKVLSDTESSIAEKSGEDDLKTRFSIVLDRIEELPAAMTIAQLLQKPTTGTAETAETTPITPETVISDIPVSVSALRLMELTDRTSAVLRSQDADLLVHSDPVLSVFQTFGQLNGMRVSSSLSVIPHAEFAGNVSEHAKREGTHMVILPWARSNVVEDAVNAPISSTSTHVTGSFDGVFKSSPSSHEQTSSIQHSEYIRGVFMNSPADVALFVDRGCTASTQQHLLLPFFGGPDDRLALSFVVQLCARLGVSATVVKVTKTDGDDTSVASSYLVTKAPHTPYTPNFADTVYGHQNTQTRMESDSADSLIWEKYTGSSTTHSASIASAISRISFSTQSSARPLQVVVDLIAARRDAGQATIAVIGRSRRMAAETHNAELKALIKKRGTPLSGEVPKTLGEMGAAIVASNAGTSLLILQAAL